jgi:hypothetical protein
VKDSTNDVGLGRIDAASPGLGDAIFTRNEHDIAPIGIAAAQPSDFDTPAETSPQQTRRFPSSRFGIPGRSVPTNRQG